MGTKAVERKVVDISKFPPMSFMSWVHTVHAYHYREHEQWKKLYDIKRP